jgi:hypothetical protein
LTGHLINGQQFRRESKQEIGIKTNGWGESPSTPIRVKFEIWFTHKE